MNKTSCLFILSLILLSACKDEKKEQTPLMLSTPINSSSQAHSIGSISNLSDKSLNYLYSMIYADTSAYQWVWDEAIIKTGDNSNATLILPEHKLIYNSELLASDDGSKENQSIIESPKNKVNVQATSANIAKFNTAIDLSKYNILLPSNETENRFTVTPSGLIDLTYNVDLEKNQLTDLTKKYQTVALKLEKRFELNKATFITDSLISISNGIEHYKIKRSSKQDNTDIDATGSIEKYNYIANSAVNKPLNSVAFSQENELNSISWTLIWNKLSNQLIPSEKLNACNIEMMNNLLQSERSKALLNRSASCYLEIIKNGRLGALQIETKIKNISSTYKLIQNDLNPKINQLKEDLLEDSFSFTAKDNLFTVLSHEENGLIDLNINGSLNNIDAGFNLVRYKIPDEYEPIVKNYLPQSLYSSIKLSSLKRSTILALNATDSFKDGVDISGIQFELALKYMTIDGIINIIINYNAPKDTIITSEQSYQDLLSNDIEHITLTVQVKDIDTLLAPIQTVIKNANLLIVILKGLAQVDEKDPSLSLFKITFDSDGTPFINGNMAPAL